MVGGGISAGAAAAGPGVDQCTYAAKKEVSGRGRHVSEWSYQFVAKSPLFLSARREP